MLLLAHDVLADRGQARLLHRLAQEGVHLLPAVLRAEVVRPLEVDRVDLLVGDEVRISIDLTPSAFAAAKSSSVRITSSSSFTSYAFMISSSGTGSFSALQTFW